MKHTPRFTQWLLVFVTISGIIALLITQSKVPALSAPSPEDTLQHAWRNAQESGTYRFITELKQTVHPAPMLANVGRTSRQDTLYIEGETDLPNRSLWMTLWQGDGNVAYRQNAVEIRFEDDQTYGRTANGVWQQVDDISAAFAPETDPMAYLAGARNVRQVGVETRVLPSPDGGTAGSITLTYTRYAFVMDGPVFASYVRDQLENYLIQNGQLPAGLHLDSSNQYRGVVGNGEVWIDSSGMPLRLTIHLEYPQDTDGERVEAEIKTDFSDFTPLPANRNVIARMTRNLGLLRAAHDPWTVLTGMTLTGLLCVMLIRFPSKQLYAALALTVIFSMIVGPLLESQQVYAFSERVASEREVYEQRQAEREAAEEWNASLLTSDWDPHVNPLAIPRMPSEDASLERDIWTLPAAFSERAVFNSLQEEGADGSADSDGDGLIDAHEWRLGTDADDSDSDGDLISDYMEVFGFEMPGGEAPWYHDGEQRWYSDPMDADTNKDGLTDSQECPERVCIDADGDGQLEMGECPPPETPCRDTDGDHIPDMFDTDNDNDGVSDRVDLSSDSVVGSPETPFTSDNPFTFVVNDVEPGLPVLVDLQLRPITATHLTYALNVLDWPEDTDGQVQHGNKTTFANSNNPALKDTNSPSAANGDLRLIPMLEVELTGDTIPLPLTSHVATRVDLSGELTGTIQLTQQGPDIHVEFDFTDALVDEVTLREGTCYRPGMELNVWEGITDGAIRTITDTNLVDLADGEHALYASLGDKEVCTDLDNLVNGPFQDQLVDLQALQPYGISVREKDHVGTLLAYVPLNVVADETGGGRVAFAARMFYRPTSENWGDAHKLRVVWLLQMLSDTCEPGTEDKDCAKQRTMDYIQVQHTYPEEWVLTGLSVREDHGMDVAIVFENPEGDTDPYIDDWLWQASYGLGIEYIDGWDCDQIEDGICVGNGRRDIAVASGYGDTTLRELLHVTSTVPLSERWGIPYTATLTVETMSFEHQDYIAHIMMTDTKRILNENFIDSMTGVPKVSAPTLLFAIEKHARSAGLGGGSWDGTHLTMGVDEDTTATLKWAPYRYTSDGGWEAYPMDDYWDLMEISYKALFQRFYPEDEEDVTLGRMLVARSYYLSLFVGLTSLVQSGEDVLYAFTAGDTDLAEDLASDNDHAALAHSQDGSAVLITEFDAGAAIAAITGEVSDELKKAASGSGVPQQAAEAVAKMDRKEFLGNLGKSIKGKVKDYFGVFADVWHSGRMGKVAVSAACAGAIIGVGATIALIALDPTSASIVGNIINGVCLLMAIHDIIEAYANVIKAYANVAEKGLKGLAKAMEAGKEISKQSKNMAIVGLVIGILVAWGSAVMGICMSGGRGYAIGAAISAAVAGTIVAVIMFAIALIPVVGWIIAAVIGVLDALANMICGFLSEEQQEGQAGRWLCGGITGMITNVFQIMFYTGDLLVDMDDPNRFQLGGFDYALATPDLGMSVGSQLDYEATVTNTIKYYPPLQGTVGESPDHLLQSSTFAYQWQDKEADLHGDLHRNAIKDWAPVENKFRIVRTVTTDQAFGLEQAGINRPASLYMSEGYAVPVQNCVLFAICWITDEKDTKHTDVGQGIKYDVFPATLDGFYTAVQLDPSADGYSLAWGQVGDVTFGRQLDFDGDGLRNQADGGADPNDSRWDTDGDGLSDLYEDQIGTRSTLFDSDGDGLDDRQELILETDPLRADSDSDGLQDGEEVKGWEFVYSLDENGPLRTWVTSDPLSPDGDGDALTDFQEKTFGFHPRVWSDPQVLTFASEVHEAGAPELLFRFDEQYGAQLFSDLSGAANNGLCEGEGCPAAGVWGRYENALLFDGVDDVVRIAHSVLNETASGLTVAAWINPSQLSGRQQIVATARTASSDGFSFGTDYTGLFFSTFGVHEYVFTSAGLHTGTWVHVAAVMDSANDVRFYVNGQYARQVNYDLPATMDRDDALLIGATTLPGSPVLSEVFDGRIDEVVVFDRALSGLDVETLMAARYNPDDLIVAPGDRLDYRAEITNELQNRYAQGLLSLDYPETLSSAVQPVPFVLQPQTGTEMSGTVQVSGSAPSGVANLTQVAGALITDWREGSDFTELWLKLDEGPGTTVFQDSSGNLPARHGFCMGDACPTAAGNGILHFDGANDSVTLPSADTLGLKGNSFTASAWIKLSDSSAYGDRAVLGTDDGLRLLIRDAKPFMGFDANGLDSSFSLETDVWHHIVYRYDLDALEQAIFVNGELKNSRTNAAAFQGNAEVSLGQVLGSSFYAGYMDDVRIFARPLSIEEIRALYGLPVLEMAFEEDGSPFTDTASDEDLGRCSGSACPATKQEGREGYSLYYAGSQHLSITEGRALDLSDGHYTVAVWIYPSGADTYPQGIIGSGSDDSDDYPALLRVGRKLRFGFSTGDQLIGVNETGDVLILNTWNHVALTCSGQEMVLYVNGIMVGSQMGPDANWCARETGQITIGRATNQGSVDLQRIYTHDEGDGLGYAEIEVMWNNVRIKYQGGVDEGDTVWINQTKVFGDGGDHVDVWEDDDYNDDHLIVRYFNTNDARSGSYTAYGNKKWTKVTLYYNITNPSIPFQGWIDTLAIYKHTLSVSEVDALYQSAFAAMRLRFDDPPGSTRFDNAVDPSATNDAVCAGSACPMSGLAGRDNQAVRFDGVDDAVDTSLMIDPSDAAEGATLMAWVFPESTRSGYHQVISSDDGSYAWSLLRQGGQWCVFTGVAPTCFGDAMVDINQWQHIAAAFDPASSTVTFYKNGTTAGTTSIPNGLRASGHAVAIGYNPGNGGEFFDGRVDDVRVVATVLPSSNIEAYYRAVPQLQLHLDEETGATIFVDSSGNGNDGLSASDSTAPTAGLKGQLGLALDFDGVDDVLTVGDAPALDVNSFTVGAWVQPYGEGIITQTLLSKGGNYWLRLAPAEDRITFGLNAGEGCTLSQNYTSTGTFLPGSWNHVMLTYNDPDLRLYLNGSLDRSVSVSGGGCANAQPLQIGGGEQPVYASLYGRVDEITLYNHALSPLEVRDIFLYQGKWVEERQNFAIMVDAEPPTSLLRSAETYRLNQEVMLQVETRDDQSGIALEEMGIKAPGQGDYSWTTAALCLDATGDSSWCPTFSPQGEGLYSLQLRGIDWVGHRETPTQTYAIYVDATPPDVSIDLPGNDPVSVISHPTQKYAWVAPLDGLVNDPTLPGGYPGSGVDSVWVTLFTPEGHIAGEGRQQATVADESWSVMYAFSDADPTNTYTVTVEAMDILGNSTQVSVVAVQVLRHIAEETGASPQMVALNNRAPTTILSAAGLNGTTPLPNVLRGAVSAGVTETFDLDARAPATHLDQDSLPAIVTEVVPFSGIITDRAVPVEIIWETDSNAVEAGLTIGCESTSHYKAAPGSLSDNRLYLWENRLHRGAACWVRLTDTAGNGGISGTVKICDTLVATWLPDDYDSTLEVQFTADATTCPPDIQVAGVDHVEVAFQPTTPDSPFFNDVMPDGLVLHLPMDDGTDVNGVVQFQDISDFGHTGRCSGDSCPQMGVNGHGGRAAYFDGVNDYVKVEGVASAISGAALSFGAWVYPSPGVEQQQGVLGFHTPTGESHNLLLYNSGTFQYYDDSGWILSAGTFAPGQWTHVMVVIDAANYGILYINGDPEAAFTTSFRPEPGDLFSIGQNYDPGPVTGDHFKGLIDDVQIFERVLFADEVRELYLGVGPVLALTFDEDVLAGGNNLVDDSGWDHNGNLESGANDPAIKTVPGKVGPYALTFDGIDDVAFVPRSSALDLDSLSMGAWIMPEQTGADQNLIVKGAGGVNYGMLLTAGGQVRFEIMDNDCYIAQQMVSTGIVAWAQWNHVMMTFDGERWTGYLNGSETVSTSVPGTGLCHNGDQVQIGPFAGQMDDVRIYPRALQAAEVYALTQSAWRPAELEQHGVAITTWHALVPDGLEGGYQLDVRGWDRAGHPDNSSQSQDVWRGEVDTTAPRTRLTRQMLDGVTDLYTAEAWDFNLAEEGFISPCGDATGADDESYQSSWYLTLGAAERLYHLTARCTAPAAHDLSPIGSAEVPNPRKIVASGTHAYVYRTGELHILDVADPTHPVEVGVYPGTFDDMVLAGHYLYLRASGYVDVVDISNPNLPQSVSQLYFGGGSGAGLSLAGEYAFIGEYNGVVIYNVGDPTNPQYVNTYYYPGDWISDMDAIGNHIYLATGYTGLIIINVQDPTEPFVTGQYTTTHHASYVTVHDNIAYVNVMMPLATWDESRLHLFNVSDPTNPQLLSDYRTPGYGGAVITEVDSRTYAYVAGGYWGLRVWDVSDPVNPVPVGFADEPSWQTMTWLAYTGDIAVAGDYAYVAYNQTGVQIYPLYNPGTGETMTACDVYGHCGTIEAQIGSLGPGVFIHAIPTAPDFISPTFRIWPEVHAVLPPAQQLALKTLPEAEEAMHLDALQAIHSIRALTVTVDATTLYTETWLDGELMGVALRYIDWIPASNGSDDGPHVIRATVANWDNPPALYSDTVTVTVDTQPPVITISPGPITSTAYYPPGLIELHGTVTDLAGVAGVQIIIAEPEEQLIEVEVEATVTGETWRALWPVDAWNPPYGLPYDLTAIATDVGGNKGYAYDHVYPDVTPPSPVTMTLQAGDEVLQPGDTVRALPASLTLGWNASYDWSGVSRYLVDWTARKNGVVTSTLHILDPWYLTDGFVVDEAAKMMVELASEDVNHNTRWQNFGPVYVDGPYTPDYILLDDENTYLGWMQSGCSLVGVDRRVARNAQGRASLNTLQKLYTTWDDGGLRLAWTGANWSNDGDLFIYLDTTSGGTFTVYNPYSALSGDPQIYLPGVTPFTTLDAMAADYLVWVQDSETAELLQWNHGEWTVAATLGFENYRFDPALGDGQTDLYLSFAQLGISDPLTTPLDMVAFASEDQRMRLWATMPPGNPVNSQLVVRTTGYATTGHNFALLHRYHWPALEPGVCPNGTGGAPLLTTGIQSLMATQGEPDAGADLAVKLSVEPAGLVYSYLGDGLFWLWETLFGDRSGDTSSMFTFADLTYTRLGDGEDLTFTLHYHNQGTTPATGVLVDITTRYALHLPEGQHKVIFVGDVAPGASGSVTFNATVDAEGTYQECLLTESETTCAPYLRLATLEAAVHDTAHPPSGPALEWLWADFQVDSQEPLFYGIQSPELLISAGSNIVRGYAYDATGVPTVTMHIQRPSGGSDTLVCPDTTSMDGRWSCLWDVTASNGGFAPEDGDIFAVRLGTVDGKGQAALQSTPQSFIVDSTPPVVTIDVEASDVITSGILLRESMFILAGDIVDNRALGSVSVCVDGDCEPADMTLDPGDVAHAYDDVPPAPIAIGASTPCNGGELVRSFVVTENFDVGAVSVGFNAQHSHRDDLVMTLASPTGTQVRLLFSDEITETHFAHYDVLLNDTAAAPYSERQDDDPTVPYYDRLARPYRPLQAFHAEHASGTWTLTICDMRPAEDDGIFQQAQLILKPLDTSSETGHWRYTVIDADVADSVEKSFAIYGEDLVGNRVAEPLWLSVTLDSVGPVITLFKATDSLTVGVNNTVMTCTVTDGGGVSDVFVYVKTPSGQFYTERLANGTASDGVSLRSSQADASVPWTVNLEPNQLGTYTLWVNALDMAGNSTISDPLQVLVLPAELPLYLPLIVRSELWAPELLLADGDLSVVAGEGQARLVVANVGQTSVIHGFRVDVYFNPDPIPTGPYQTWQDLTLYGGTWLVDGMALPLRPGEVITLTLYDAYYQAFDSHYPLNWSMVNAYYVQVDTLNEVLEIQELSNTYYNNISGEVLQVIINDNSLYLPTIH